MYENRQTTSFERSLKTTDSYLCIVQFVLYAILAYIAYQFIFKLVIPIFMTTRKIKKGFREMQSKMDEQMKQQQPQQGFRPQASKDTTPKPEPKVSGKDYIDFEEIK